MNPLNRDQYSNQGIVTRLVKPFTLLENTGQQLPHTTVTYIKLPKTYLDSHTPPTQSFQRISMSKTLHSRHPNDKPNRDTIKSLARYQFDLNQCTPMFQFCTDTMSSPP